MESSFVPSAAVPKDPEWKTEAARRDSCNEWLWGIRPAHAERPRMVSLPGTFVPEATEICRVSLVPATTE